MSPVLFRCSERTLGATVIKPDFHVRQFGSLGFDAVPSIYGDRFAMPVFLSLTRAAALQCSLRVIV